MKKYQYKIYTVDYSIWSGKADEDYLEIINEYGTKEWRFIGFSPSPLAKRSEGNRFDF
jgi:hypothetical protein